MIVGVNFVVGAGFGLLLMRLRNRSLRLRLPSQKITATKSTQISVVFMIILLSNCSSCKMLTLLERTTMLIENGTGHYLYVLKLAGLNYRKYVTWTWGFPSRRFQISWRTQWHYVLMTYSARILVKIDFVINGKLIWQTTVTLGTGEPS